MKKCLFILLAITLFSCDRQTDFEKKLIKSKWVLFAGDQLKDEYDRWPSGYYRFFDDGSFKNFHISDSEIPFVNDDGSERKDPFIWSYSSYNKELIINNINLKVISIEGDTIRLLRDTTNIMLYNIDKTHAKLKKGPGRCLGS